MIRPTSVDDARAITESLLGGRTVILNLKDLIWKLHRIIDFISGAAFAINGNLEDLYIHFPCDTNVDLSGDYRIY